MTHREIQVGKQYCKFKKSIEIKPALIAKAIKSDINVNCIMINLKLFE